MAEEYDRPLLPVKAKIDPGSAGPRQIKIPLNSAKTAKTASTSAFYPTKPCYAGPPKMKKIK
jgi:hypothetical protein